MGDYLPVRCLPEYDEALGSFVSRLAAANGYDRVDWLLAAAGLPRSFASLECDLGRLAELTGASVKSINEMAIWPVGGRPGYAKLGLHEITQSAVVYGRPRLCFACFCEGLYVRRCWQLRPVIACPVHRVNLIDGCPVCDRAFDLTKLRYKCRCGWSTQESGAMEPADHRLLAIAGTIEAVIAGSSVPNAAAPLKSLDCAIRLLWLVATSAGAAGGWRSLEMSKPRVRDLVPLLVTASPILLEWPTGLHEWLGSRKQARGERSGVDAEFGPWLARLSCVLRCNGCGDIAEEVRRWLADHWGRGTFKRGSFLAPSGSDHAIMTAKEVAEKLNISSSSVSRLLRAGELEGESRIMGTRTAVRIYRQSVERWMAESVADHDAATTAKIVGAPVSTIHVLRRLGVLKARMRSIGGRRQNRFSDEAVVAFAAGLAAKSTPLRSRMAGLVRLRDLPGRRQANLGLTLVSILNGDITCWRDRGANRKPILDQIFVRLSEVSRRRTDGVESFSVREAAALLGMSLRMIPVLVRAGCVHTLRGANKIDHGLLKRTLDARSVHSFPKIYIMTREIAMAKGTNTRSTLNSLKAIGLNPVVEPNSSKGISAVWRRSDVSRIVSGSRIHGFRGATSGGNENVRRDAG